MNVIVVGAGIIGKERIKALESLNENIIAVVDPIKYKYLDDRKYVWCSDLKHCYELSDKNIDWVFISVPHDKTSKITSAILARGLNCLIEKPMGRDLFEYETIEKYINDQKVNVGFNYRFFKGVNQLLLDCKNNFFGDLISVNMILSLGDAKGSEKLWRLDPGKAGRGAILDPGIHLIDIAMLISDNRLYQGQIKTWKGFWKTGIEEESHLIARDSHTGTIYNIQSSVCHWRNTFHIEVNGTDGYGIVEGRNRYYGNQTYRRGKRWGWQEGKSQRESEELVVDYAGEDSFLEETRAVLYGCNGIQPATHEDNRRCLEFIESL